MTQKIKRLIKEEAERGNIIFDGSTDESVKESIRIMKDAGIPEERIEEELVSLFRWL